MDEQRGRELLEALTATSDPAANGRRVSALRALAVPNAE
jgi:hypothetical protein